MYDVNGIDGARGKSTASSGTNSPAAIKGCREAGASASPRTQASKSRSNARCVQRCCAKFIYCLNCCPVLGGNAPPECGVPAKKYKRDVEASATSLRPSSVVCVNEPARAQYSVDENV